ncbi:unnamed protein product [Musa acuminata subsp. burmannicoides]
MHRGLQSMSPSGCRPLLVMSPPCHGLFCLYHIYMELDVCLYNPATCKSFSLPHNFTSVNIILSYFCLGYHPGSRQYKVIHTFTSLAMEALTVGGSTWRKVEVSSALALLTLLNWGRPSATGTMYWLAQNNVLEDIILSLDLDNERLTQVPFPDIKRQHERGNNSLIEMEGTIHLAIHWFAMVDWLDIWMLQESGAHRVWIHRFHLHLCALPTGVGQVERVLPTLNPANPSPPERSCKLVISAAFRFPQSAVYCPTIMICYAVSGREGEEPAGGPRNPWGSRMRTNEVAGNRLWGMLASMVRMMPDLLDYEQKDVKTFVLWAMFEAPPAKNVEMTELPSDLFMEILSWIPARALLKLRCVCKCWYSITTDLDFVRLHQQQQQLLPEVTSILTFHRHFTNVRSLLSRLDVVDAPWVAKHVAVWHSRPLLVMSPPCHGLFCLYHIYMELDVCLYNPATCKSFSLPHNFTSVNIILSDFCLGYHPGSRQYKVIHTFCTRSTSLAMEALTVGGSTWRKVEVSSALAMLTLLNWGRPSATGTMYWLAQKNVLEDIILSLDLDNERLTQVPFPDIKRQHERGNNSLIEMEGTIHLAIHWFAMVDWMDIWMLQESGAHRVWIHRFHLHLCALPTGVGQVERVLPTLNPANPSLPERSCKLVFSAAFRFPQSAVYCPTIMICYAVSGREGEEPAGGPRNPWGSRMRYVDGSYDFFSTFDDIVSLFAGNRLWGILASMVRMMPDLLGYEQKDVKTFVLWAMFEAPPAKNVEMMELPSDLFMEILSWIPARALLKLRCVCKCWYSITTDLAFVRLHHQQQQLLPRVTSVHAFHRHFTDDVSLLSRLDVVDATWVARDVAVWHSRPLLAVSPPCHGLFCLYHVDVDFDVCLYNPTTRKSFSLPHNFTSVNIILSDFCVGYHPVSRQYKVIHTFCTRSTSLVMEVLTVGGSTWRKVEVSSALGMLTMLNRGRPSATGTMYWLGQRNLLEDAILSLDLENERITEVPLPDIEPQHESGNNSLIEMEGTIHFAIHWFTMADWMDIWMLQESGAHRVWIHKFHLRLCALPRGVGQVERVLRPPTPLLINQGKILISDCRRLVSYDLASKGFQHEVVFQAYDDFFPFVIVESLDSF